MSATIRPYVNGGWEADIRVLLPDGSVIRERKKAPTESKSAAQRWAEARERVLLTQGKPKPIRKEAREDNAEAIRCAFSRAVRESWPARTLQARREARQRGCG